MMNFDFYAISILYSPNKNKLHKCFGQIIFRWKDTIKKNGFNRLISNNSDFCKNKYSIGYNIRISNKKNKKYFSFHVNFTRRSAPVFVDLKHRCPTFSL